MHPLENKGTGLLQSPLKRTSPRLTSILPTRKLILLVAVVMANENRGRKISFQLQCLHIKH